MALHFHKVTITLALLVFLVFAKPYKHLKRENNLRRSAQNWVRLPKVSEQYKPSWNANMEPNDYQSSIIESNDNTDEKFEKTMLRKRDSHPTNPHYYRHDKAEGDEEDAQNSQNLKGLNTRSTNTQGNKNLIYSREDRNENKSSDVEDEEVAVEYTEGDDESETGSDTGDDSELYNDNVDYGDNRDERLSDEDSINDEQSNEGGRSGYLGDNEADRSSDEQVYHGSDSQRWHDVETGELEMEQMNGSSDEEDEGVPDYYSNYRSRESPCERGYSDNNGINSYLGSDAENADSIVSIAINPAKRKAIYKRNAR